MSVTSRNYSITFTWASLFCSLNHVKNGNCFLWFAGGAGGKGTWGAYGSELTGDGALDYKDPNYDSESLDNGDIHLEAIIPEMSDDEMQVRTLGLFIDHLAHGCLV